MADAVVHGVDELQRGNDRAVRRLHTQNSSALRELAEPIRSLAQSRALTSIRNMPRSPQWAEMRTGVAPVARGTRGRGRRGRPALAGRLLDRAMIPALEQHQAAVVQKYDRMLADVEREWAE